TDIGKIITDLSFKPAPDSAVYLSGNLGTDNFELNKLLDDKSFGRLSFYGKADGVFKNIEELNVNVDLSIPLFELKNYPYKDIKMKGLVSDKMFQGKLSCDDKNLNFDFKGKVDFAKKMPEFDFHLNLRKADLVKLNISTQDSISKLSMMATADFVGSNINNVEGFLSISDGRYVSGKGEYVASNIDMNVRRRGNDGIFSLASDIVNARMIASGDLQNIPYVLEDVIKYYIPAYSDVLKLKPRVKEEGDTIREVSPNVDWYELRMQTKNTEGVLVHVVPDLYVADSTIVYAKLSSGKEKLLVSINSPGVSYRNENIRDLRLDVVPKDSILNMNIRTRKIESSSFELDNFLMSGTLSYNGLDFKSDYQTNITSGNFNAHVDFYKDSTGWNSISADILPSRIALGDSLWDLSNSRVIIEKDNYVVDGFQIKNGNQLLRVDGNVSKYNPDTLRIEFNNVSVVPLLLFMGKDFDLSGVASGSATANRVLTDKPLFFANLDVKDIVFDKKEIGDLQLKSFIEPGEKDITIMLKLNKGRSDIINMGGILRQNGTVLANATLNGVQMSFLSPILRNVMSEVEGNVSGGIKVTGELKDIMLNGGLELDSGAFRVNYLNTKYTLKCPIEVSNSTLKIKNAIAYDVKGRPATISATFGNITRPALFNYSLSITPKNLQVLNTMELDNEMFYGNAYATGVVRIRGSKGRVVINGLATTEPNTQVAIPLGRSNAQKNTSFISFVSPKIELEKDSKKEKTVKKPSELIVDLNLTVNSNADVVLVLNQATGDVIRASGTGNIKMEVQPIKNIFRVFGNYVILQGDYTVQNFGNKKFKIDNGSYINFNGNIADATFNIQATYNLRASLSDLFSDTTARYSRVVPINCKVHMTDKIISPNIKLEIEAPTVDVETRDRMRSQLNTEDNIAGQFLALLIAGRFMPSQQDGGVAQVLPSSGGVVLGELLSSQVGNLISQLLGGNVSVGITYNPTAGTNADATDFGVSLSTNITDRVIFSGNVEYQSTRSQLSSNNSDWIGDVDVEVLLDKSGKLRLKAFSHANDQYTEMAVGVTNKYGVGVVYQEDFNSFSDLWNAIFKRKKKATPQKNPRENP
ncbi:MAG: translocation/assembly module TamB, partial [Prevotellaceae bacterium]|nr:translocation/assembly module TamB [Prevotellaceae bacterium]